MRLVQVNGWGSLRPGGQTELRWGGIEDPTVRQLA